MKLDTLTHPKTFDLSARLKCNMPETIGYLEYLWKFVGQHATEGNIGKWDNGAIARASLWAGPPDIFVNSLIESGFFDESEKYRLVVHDWKDHAHAWVRAKLKKQGLEFIEENGQQLELIQENIDQKNDKEIRGGGLSLVSTKAEKVDFQVNKVTEKAEKVDFQVNKVTENKTSSRSKEKRREEKSRVEKRRVTKDMSDSIKIIFKVWQKCCQHPRSHLDNKRKTLIKKSLNLGYSVEDLSDAIFGCSITAFNQGINDNNQKYDSLELILRDADHIDKYKRNWDSPPKPKNLAEKNWIANNDAASEALKRIHGNNSVS